MRIRLLLLSVFMIFTADFGKADSATWNLNPVDNNWNNPANWTPAIVPDEQATLGVSNVTHIFSHDFFSVDSIVFNPGASAFTLFMATAFGTHSFSGAGIINNSGVVQNFVVRDSANLSFYGSASAGDNVVITNEGGISFYGAATEFYNNSTAANATLINEGSLISGTMTGGGTIFEDYSSAESATVINNPGAVSGAAAGNTFIALYSPGNLGTSTFIANAATVPGAQAGYVHFQGGTCAGASFIANGATIADAQGGLLLAVLGDGYATFTANGGNGTNAQGGFIYLMWVPVSAQTVVTANGGTNGGLGGIIQIQLAPFLDLPQFQVFGNGTLDLTVATGSVSVGSLSGSGIVSLGTRTLYVGNNNLSTSFSGVIQDYGRIVKSGTGKLTLTGANTYTGLTRVSAGVLIVNNTSGSATGTGYVNVDAGTLGGKGIIQGAVAIGTGSGAGAILAPSVGTNQLATLTLSNTLTFKADGTYAYRLNINNVRADQVIANGVTIGSGAQFSLQSIGNRRLAISTVFTAISNTSVNAITGTFANLPDGSTFTAGGNNFQVSYSGGDGNDLTLTVVP
jgi:autotransporter-associated beta strand protein